MWLNCKVIKKSNNTFCTLAFTITGCISISGFASSLGIPIGILSSAIGLKLVQQQQELKIVNYWEKE